MTDTALNQLRKLSAYRQQREHIFPSYQSLQWFVRRNRGALIDAGALVMLTGQWHAHEAAFDAYVLQAGAEAAKRHAE